MIQPGTTTFALLALLVFSAAPTRVVALELGVGAGLLQFDFKEFVAGKQIVSETGTLSGVTGTLSHAFDRDTHASLTASYGLGKTDHDGLTQQGRPFMSKTDQSLTQVNGRIGRVVRIQDADDVTLYGSWGRHYWRRNIRGQNNVSGLLERYTWWELGAGISIPFQAAARRELVVDLAVLQQVSARLDAQIPGFDEAELPLSERWGLRLQVHHIWKSSSKLQYMLTAFAEGWDFARSANVPLRRNGVVVGSVFEPDSETRNLGLRFSAVARF